MSAGEHNFVIEKGSTFNPDMQFSSGGSVEDGGTALDLTGYSAEMHIRVRLADTAPALELSTDNGRIDIYDPIDGKVRLLLTDEETQALTFASGVYDLELETSGGMRKRYLQGKIKVTPEVTRDA